MKNFSSQREPPLSADLTERFLFVKECAPTLSMKDIRNIAKTTRLWKVKKEEPTSFVLHLEGTLHYFVLRQKGATNAQDALKLAKRYVKKINKKASPKTVQLLGDVTDPKAWETILSLTEIIRRQNEVSKNGINRRTPLRFHTRGWTAKEQQRLVLK